jgi:nucleoside-diphosphate-sugar epimerase
VTGIVAITGATGFVGRHVVERIGASGRAMRLLVRKGPYTCGFGTAENVIGNLADETSLRCLVRGAAAVIHIAGAIAAPDRQGFFAVNAQGTRRLAEAAAAEGAKRFILVSSLAAREPRLSDYGASKQAGEDAVTELGGNLDLTILRPPVIYGPGDRASLPLLAQLTRRIAFIPGSPRSRFSLLHVGDLARLIAELIDEDPRGIHEIDDGTKGGYSWPDVLAIAEASAGRPIMPVYLPRGLTLAASYPAAAMARLVGRAAFFSPDKVRQLYHPDWVCRTSLLVPPSAIRFAEGFAETVRWYREQGWLPASGAADRRRARGDGKELLS